MLLHFASPLLILGFGVLYPLYHCFKVIRYKKKIEYLPWLTYWMVFTLYSCVEKLADFILPWIPLYYELKILFIIWLLPTTRNGSEQIYRKFLHPFLKRKERNIDASIVGLKGPMYRKLVELKNVCIENFRNFLVDLTLTNLQPIADDNTRALELVNTIQSIDVDALTGTESNSTSDSDDNQQQNTLSTSGTDEEYRDFEFETHVNSTAVKDDTPEPKSTESDKEIKQTEKVEHQQHQKKLTKKKFKKVQRQTHCSSISSSSAPESTITELAGIMKTTPEMEPTVSKQIETIDTNLIETDTDDNGAEADGETDCEGKCNDIKIDEKKSSDDINADGAKNVARKQKRITKTARKSELNRNKKR